MKNYFILVFLFISIATFGQKAIKGNIVDEKGEPLIGATVVVSGTTKGTVTNIDGHYELSVSANDQELTYSYIGYLAKKILIGNKTTINVAMTPDQVSLSEIVVIGYGTTKKSDLTSSISTIKSEELSKLPVTTLEQSLQGRAAGVTVIQSATPGGGATIRIRGTNSPNGTDPLWVVDGIIGAQAPNSNDVESMQILKDAAACAIYGSRGSNGVIIVSTKKGKKGEPKMTLNSFYGWQDIKKNLAMMDGNQYIQYWQNNKAVNNYVGPNGEKYPNGLSMPARVDSALVNPGKYNANTNWLDQIYRNGSIHNLNFSISNGSETGNYFVSVDNKSQDGVQVGSGFQQTSLQVNSELKKGIFKIGENLNAKQSSAGDNGSRLQSALRQSPLLAVRNIKADGEIELWPGNTSLDNSNNPNPVADIMNHYYKNVSDVIQLAVYAEADLFKGMTFKSNYSTIIANSNDQSKGFKYLDGQAGPQNTTVSMSVNSNRSVYKQFENILTFNRSIAKHNIVLMGGYTREASAYRALNTNHSGFNVSNPETYASKEPNTSDYISGYFEETSLQSVIARATYNFNSRYYLTANVRRDGSSKFLEGHRWSTFPSVSLAWRISDESFLKNIRQIKYLKLRASYGSIGSQSGIGAYNLRSLSSSANYVFGNSTQQGITQGGIIDKNLTWETTYSSNLGFDLELFDGLLSLTADYFNKNTKGLLLNTPVPFSAGLDYRSSVFRNAGDVNNKGLEITSSIRKKLGDFSFDISANFTKEKTTVTSLIKDQIFSGATQYYSYLTNTAVGHGIGDFYGYVFNGIYQIGDKDILAGLQAGDVRYKDLNGDGKITAEDQTFIGKSVPDYTFGLTINAEWKNFDLSIFFQGVQGNQIFNHNLYHTEIFAKGFNQSTKALDAWRPDNPSTTVPRYTDQHTNNYALPSSRFIEDGSYIRLQNLTLGYTVTNSLMSKIKIDKLRFYASAQNLLTFTRYSGIDPEVNSAAPSWDNMKNTFRGIDNSLYPVAKTYVVGMELNF